MYRFTQHGDSFVRREVDTRRPLLLDSISSERAPRTSSWLFQLPSHILADIVAYVASGEDGFDALALLALANSDCLQLARSHKFTEIRANPSPRSTELFEELEREAVATAEDQMDNDNPYLGERPLKVGHCVRRLTFGPELSRRYPDYSPPFTHFFIMGVHKLAMMGGAGFDSPPIVASLVEDYVRLRQAEAEDEGRMAMVMRSLPALPNLSVIVWENGYHVDRTFFEHITRTTAKHVQLNEMFIKEPSLLIESRLPPVWPLVTLEIQLLGTEVMDDTFTGFDAPYVQLAAVQFQTIFQLCAPTLESLTWRYGRHPIPSEIVELQPIHFPRLVHLDMTNVVPAMITLSHILTSPVLRRVALPAKGWTRTLAVALVTHTLFQLQSLSIPGTPEELGVIQVMIGFLRRHTHLTTLRVGEAVPPSVGHDETAFSWHFLPLLGQFHSLTRLIMSWHGSDFPQPEARGRHGVVLSESVLRHIGSMTNLRYLSLGVSGSYLDIAEWRVDHNAIRWHLSKLVNLRVLALHHDSYLLEEWPGQSGYSISHFYTQQVTSARDMDEADARPWLSNSFPHHGHVGSRFAHENVWERAHRNRMLTQGEAYAGVLPSLAWVFCGQRWMEFCRWLNEIQAQPITGERFPNQTVGSAMTWLENAGLVSDRE